MAIETRPNDEPGRAWLAAEEAAGSYMLVNEKFISKLTGDDVPAAASTREISTEAFRDRFTAPELLGVVSSTDTVIKYALLKLSTKERPVISLDNPEVVATVDRLVMLGLLSPARAATILA